MAKSIINPDGSWTIIEENLLDNLPNNLPVPVEPIKGQTVPKQEVKPPPPPRNWAAIIDAAWNSLGRVVFGAALAGCGVWIAYQSIRGNAWFGHSLTPDPDGGDIYSNLSVTAEIILCILPTVTRFYWRDGRRGSAVQGWGLLLVPLVVVFFATGGFAVKNMTLGIEARQDRDTPEIADLRREIASYDKTLETLGVSIAAECTKRGSKCQGLEGQRTTATEAQKKVFEKLAQARAAVQAEADPFAAVLGVPSLWLRMAQAGAIAALCLMAGLIISCGSGLIWRWALGAA